MKTVYVDEMFVLNLVINYFILLATAKLCAVTLNRARFAASAAVGALYSVALLLPRLEFLASPVMKLCLGAFMTLIAFGYSRKLFRMFAAFLAVSAAFGGAVFAAELLAGRSPDDGLYIEISFKVLVLSFAICYFVLTLVFRRFGRRRGRYISKVEVSSGGRSAVFTALHDTGNELFDPISGDPVIVVNIAVLEALLPDGAAEALKRGVFDFCLLLKGEGLKFRLVPFGTVGSRSALMPVFRPDSIYVDGQVKKELLVGLTSNSLSADGEFSAVL